MSKSTEEPARISEEDLRMKGAAFLRLQQAEAVWQFTAEVLRQRYQLGDGDTIDEAGVIRRGEKVP